MYILPQVKNYIEHEGSFVFNKTMTVSEVSGIFKAGINLFERNFSLCGFEIIKSTNPLIKIEQIEDKGKVDYYRLTVTKEGIKIECVGALSFRNAIATLIAVTTSDSGVFSMPCCEIEDYADFGYRSFMLDVARQYIDIDVIKERIFILAKAKYTVLHIHLFDTERYAIKSEAVPELNTNPIFRQYTIEEMKEIVRYAESFGIEVLPEIDLPGHGLYVLEKLPDIRCEKDGEKIGIWDLCVANEQSYKVIDLLIEELTKIFTYDYIHMGGDELSFYDMKDSGYWPNWYECDKCTELAKEKGYTTASDFYCHFVRRVYDIVKSHGKKLMIWNDSIDISKTPDLPRDILIEFWRVAMETRGPNKGCSMERFLEEGFNVVNAFYEETYCDDYIVESRLAKWTPVNSPKIDLKYKNQVLGGEICAWGIRNHFDYTLPANLYIFANRLWNSEETDEEKSRSALTRQLLCADKDLPDIFELLGGCMMPLYGDKKYCENASKDRAKVLEAIEKLTRKLAEGRYDALAIKPIITCLEDLRNSLPEEKKGE